MPGTRARHDNLRDTLGLLNIVWVNCGLLKVCDPPILPASRSRTAVLGLATVLEPAAAPSSNRRQAQCCAQVAVRRTLGRDVVLASCLQHSIRNMLRRVPRVPRSCVMDVPTWGFRFAPDLPCWARTLGIQSAIQQSRSAVPRPPPALAPLLVALSGRRRRLRFRAPSPSSHRHLLAPRRGAWRRLLVLSQDYVTAVGVSLHHTAFSA